MRFHRFRRFLAGTVASACLAACSFAEKDVPGAPVAGAGSPKLVESPGSTLPARWWLWAESAGSRNPIIDPTGADCGVNQPDDVWFLAGTFGGAAERTCVVPRGRPIFSPVMNLICEVVDGADPERALAECSPRPDSMSAVLDGKDLEIYSATSQGAFTFDADPASMIAAPGSSFDAVAGGMWVGPLAIPAGEHVLRFAATTEEFDLDVTYGLTVK